MSVGEYSERRSRAKLVLAVAAYIASIVIANYATSTFGLVSIGFGLAVTAGTFAAGAALILRDAVQVYGNRWFVLGAILAGAVLSVAMATPAIAVASGLAFLVSELVDWAVFTPIRSRSLPLAVVVSSVVSAPVDTVLFFYLAGFGVTLNAVLGQFIVKTALALVAAGVIALLARRRSPVSAVARS
jgi:uncharacterized PurR-regulated membrane protein YhhQ (DUF165 family)